MNCVSVYSIWIHYAVSNHLILHRMSCERRKSGAEYGSGGRIWQLRCGGYDHAFDYSTIWQLCDWRCPVMLPDGVVTTRVHRVCTQNEKDLYLPIFSFALTSTRAWREMWFWLIWDCSNVLTDDCTGTLCAFTSATRRVVFWCPAKNAGTCVFPICVPLNEI